MSDIIPENRAVAALYTALFGRAPDANGFDFWAQAYANGASLTTLAQTFLASPEALAIYPASQTDAQFVITFYASVFGRAPDADGLAFWSAALAANGGAASGAARAALVRQITDIVSAPLTSKPSGMSDAAYAQAINDRAIFGNKIEFSVYFATELRSNDLALAKATLALVGVSPTSIVAATNLALGIVDPVPPIVLAPAITAADSPNLINSKFAPYTGTEATVNATGMDALQLDAVASNAGKIGAAGITGLGLTLNTLSDTITTTLLPKSSGTTVVATGASATEITSLLGNLSHVASAGISGSLDLSMTNFTSLGGNPGVVTLNTKLASGATVKMTGTTGAEFINLASLSVGVRVHGGGGADTITLGGGADTVVIASKADSRSTEVIDVGTSLLTVFSISSNDVLLFSPLADVFGSGLTLAGATPSLTTIAGPASVANYSQLFSLANAVSPVASSAATANFYLLELATPIGGVAAYLILNDGNATIDGNDTIIIVGEGVTAANVAFGA